MNKEIPHPKLLVVTYILLFFSPLIVSIIVQMINEKEREGGALLLFGMSIFVVPWLMVSSVAFILSLLTTKLNVKLSVILFYITLLINFLGMGWFVWWGVSII